MLAIWTAMVIIDLSVCIVRLLLSLFGMALISKLFLQLMTKIFNNKSTVSLTESDTLRRDQLYL